MFGNTMLIADAIADGVSSRISVEIAEVGGAATTIDDEVALLVIGGPTHAFGMSWPGTRQSAAQQAVHGVMSGRIGLREWLGAIRRGSADVAVATFDTRIDRPHLPGSAARCREALATSRLSHPRASGELLCHRHGRSTDRWRVGPRTPLGDKLVADPLHGRSDLTRLGRSVL
jgi:hypothetical protein